MEDKQPSSDPRDVKTYRPVRMKEPVPESVSRSWVWGRNDKENGAEVEERE